MHKIFIGLMVIFFLGDPSLQTLAWLGEMKTLYCCCCHRDGFHTLRHLSARRVTPAPRQPDTARASTLRRPSGRRFYLRERLVVGRLYSFNSSALAECPRSGNGNSVLVVAVAWQDSGRQFPILSGLSVFQLGILTYYLTEDGTIRPWIGITCSCCLYCNIITQYYSKSIIVGTM